MPNQQLSSKQLNHFRHFHDQLLLKLAPFLQASLFLSAHSSMATSLHSHQTPFLKTPLPIAKSNTPAAAAAAAAAITSYTPIRCGPRDNRGPLVKGRILSIEAIQAVQALKRAQRSDPTTLPTVACKTLSRLIKSDLLAALKELLRQEQCALALHVFSAVRSEYNPDLSFYADLVTALWKKGMAEDIDRLIFDLETEVGGARWDDDKGLTRLVRAVIAAKRRESTVRIYEMLKRRGLGSSGFKANDYTLGALSKGLRTLGEVALADEVDREFGRSYKGSLEKVKVK